MTNIIIDNNIVIYNVIDSFYWEPLILSCSKVILLGYLHLNLKDCQTIYEF